MKLILDSRSTWHCWDFQGHMASKVKFRQQRP